LNGTFFDSDVLGAGVLDNGSTWYLQNDSGLSYAGDLAMHDFAMWSRCLDPAEIQSI